MLHKIDEAPQIDSSRVSLCWIQAMVQMPDLIGEMLAAVHKVLDFVSSTYFLMIHYSVDRC